MRRGVDYLGGLSDGREVWLDGSRVRDVAGHKSFFGNTRAIADLYDMQHEEPYRQLLVANIASSTPSSRSLDVPRSFEDLALRGRAHSVWAERTFGMLGRTPDYANSILMAFACASDFFGSTSAQWAENAARYHGHCQNADVYLTHASINPQANRAAGIGHQQNPHIGLGVVREQDDGLIVRGAKMIGTAVPISDEILVFPLPKLEAGDEPYTVCFAIPVATKGLRLVCRETLHRADTVGFDHPLSSRFDELDALCIFDDVLVPWDRVFFYGSVEAANNLYDATYARHFTAYQGSLRAFARLKLIVGIAIELAETSGSDGFIHVQEMLGELLGDLELIDGAISLGAGSGSLSTRGAFIPKIEPLLALRYQLPRITARAHEVVMILGGGSLLGSPTLHDVDGPVWHEMERYFAGNGAMEPRSRIGLLKLAWDAVGEGFGQRQLQFERYNAGDPVRIAGSLYRGYNTDELRRTVDRALADPSQRTVAPES